MTTDVNPQASFSTLVVRVWQEQDHAQGFRARLYLGPATGGEPLVGAASSPDGVLEWASRWLQGLVQEDVPPQRAAAG
ncbi:hypothetical protein LVY72_03720 [Arthrobacter sp. I2-34]|uniref:Uncharacterized protein n=1 Tax=Arthrobacter hankyongi TaxID=2904801 RepID=A0ABS9L333_9MICC|nr:hypothetical protein [Arthrobacter hankyongi]MCG2621020.1 hypothetical protein [Arthrobacter hankyongi]